MCDTNAYDSSQSKQQKGRKISYALKFYRCIIAKKRTISHIHVLFNSFTIEGTLRFRTGTWDQTWDIILAPVMNSILPLKNRLTQ